MRRRRTDAGLSMIELMFAIAVLAIALAAVAACTQTGFVTDAASFDRTRSTKIAQRLMEEVLELNDTGTALMVDENGAISEGFAVKVNVTSVGLGLIEVEVIALRPTGTVTAEEVTAMSMDNFRVLPCATGSKVRLLSLKADGL